ncbi:MAG: GFA family protein [Pseudomonadota bacterium]
MSLTGKCLCGAVSYTISKDQREVGACHCSSCQAWSGGVFIGIQAGKDEAVLTGEENLTIFKSSEWAERAFCSKCGSSLFYRVTAPGPMQGDFHFGAGTLTDWDGLAMNDEIFIDRKPDAYAFAGTRKQMTGAEMMALFAPPDGS